MFESRLNHEEKKEVYQNARLLLSQYSKVLWRLNQEVEEMDEMIKYDLGTDLFSYIDALADIDTAQKSRRLKRRLSSLENSKSLVCMIDKSVDLLKTYPVKGDLYFSLVNDRFLKIRPDKVEDILNVYSISRRTYYREIHIAVDIVGNILWGFVLANSKDIAI